mgnify:CR=1 FL=1
MAETFNNQSTVLSSTSAFTVYTAPNASGNRAIVLSCLVANVDGANNAEITLYLASNSSTSALTHIAKTIVVPADSTVELIPNKLVLTQGQRLRAVASAANDLDVTVSVLEIT